MFFENVRQLKPTDFNETYITFVKNFIAKAYAKQDRKQKEESKQFMSEFKSIFGMKRETKSNDLPKFFNLQLLYTIMIDRDSKPENRNKALESLIELLCLSAIP